MSSHRPARHCPQCGAALERAQVEGRERSRCAACRFVVYENPTCASAALVVDAVGRVLLVRRAIDPCKGDWALPAGYQEIDEEPSAAAEREAREECGLEVRSEQVFDVFLVRAPDRKPCTLSVFLCRYVAGTPCAGDDALEARWFELDALPPNIAFDNATRILSRLRTDPRYRSHLRP